MKLMIWRRAWQRGHSSGSTCQTRLISAAQGKAGPRHAVIVDLEDVALLVVDFGAEAAGFTGIPAEITSQVPSGVGDVLGELGDEVQGVEDLEVPLLCR